MPWPRIVAESLLRVEPVAAGFPMAPAPVATTVARIAGAGAPGRSTATPPAFLLPAQQDAWRRVTAALTSHGGVMLAERTGSGKTWIALAAARQEAGAVVAFVPAVLRHQWEEAAARANVALACWTHERVSRGALPRLDATLAIIDEAHRLRDPGTRRVRTLAPWLVGRRTLLLTATPIVNRVADLVALLRLAVPEDALALDDIPRLGDLETAASPPRAIRRIAIRSQPPATASIARRMTIIEPDAAECDRAERAVAAVRELRLSRSPPVRRLLVSVLLDAAASSDAALHAALRRYRALLRQSRDAGGLSRAMLRRFAGDTLDQLVLWPMVALPSDCCDLPLDDLPGIDAILQAPPRTEQWVAELTMRVASGPVTTCFTRHRATARELRDAMGDAAWVTGSSAGIGHHRMPRQAILAAFGSRRDHWRMRRVPPRTLIATDVAAEGLDLHACGRIVHVDLPWTAVRMEQREGRLLRLGQQHQEVEVVVRRPAPPIEAALAAGARIGRKRRTAERWLRVLEEDDDDVGSTDAATVATVATDGGTALDLVAVTLRRGTRCGATVLVRRAGGEWCTEAEAIAEARRRLRVATPAPYNGSEAAAVASDAARAALVRLETGASGSPALIERILRLARSAAARRDGSALARLDRLLRFAAASPSLGMRMRVAELVALGDADLIAAAVPEIPRAAAATAVPRAVLCLR